MTQLQDGRAYRQPGCWGWKAWAATQQEGRHTIEAAGCCRWGLLRGVVVMVVAGSGRMIDGRGATTRRLLLLQDTSTVRGEATK